MKILVVTTSNDRFEGANPHPTGVWLEEFAVPFMEFLRNGVEMTVASPKGGQMPVDPRSLPTPEQEQQWQPALAAARQTVRLAEVTAEDYEAIFLPGGHGPMFDLPEDADLQRLLREFHAAGKIISAVCHGPAGLVGATLADGTPLVKGKTLTAYTYAEEVAAKLDTEVPFILENRLRELGAHFIGGENRADHVERDGRLITGQNPNSSQSIARYVVAALKGQLPPIFDHTPKEIVLAKTIAEFPVNTFLENIAVSQDGDLYLTSYEEGTVYRVTTDGEKSVHAKPGKNATGVAFDRHGDLLVAGNADDGTPTLFRISDDGATESLVALPDAMFLNGMTHLTDDCYLIADSYRGAIWEVDTEAKTARIWLQHEWLARSDVDNPFPAVNGVKMFGDALYLSNTQRQTMVRISVTAEHEASTPVIFATNVNIDDFAFDARGYLYGTTHVYNSVVRIAPDGEVITIAEAEHGMTGSTALAFGRTIEDRDAIYVTTNGGMSLPPMEGVQPGKVVRLEVGVEGYAVDLG